MKTKQIGAMALLLSCGALPVSAFTLDFATLTTGTAVPNAPAEILLAVPGYGNVGFSSGLGSSLEVATVAGSGGPTQAINMNVGETMVVTFHGANPMGVTFGYDAVSLGGTFSSFAPLDPKQIIVALSGSNGATGGVSSVSFQAVPEPSAALLGGLGAIGLVVRRRR